MCSSDLGGRVKTLSAVSTGCSGPCVWYCTRLSAELWSWSRSRPVDGPHGLQETALIYPIDR